VGSLAWPQNGVEEKMENGRGSGEKNGGERIPLAPSTRQVEVDTRPGDRIDRYTDTDKQQNHRTQTLGEMGECGEGQERGEMARKRWRRTGARRREERGNDVGSPTPRQRVSKTQTRQNLLWRKIESIDSNEPQFVPKHLTIYARAKQSHCLASTHSHTKSKGNQSYDLFAHTFFS